MDPPFVGIGVVGCNIQGGIIALRRRRVPFIQSLEVAEIMMDQQAVY